MATYKTEGLILKRINFGEADKVLTIFTKHYGKICALAKGIRRITSRKGGNLELFNWVILFLFKGRNLDIITEAQVKDSFPGFRKDLKRIGIAYYFCELVDKLCPERQKNQEVFALLGQHLKGLEKKFDDSNYQTNFIRDFEVKLLEELGFWPKGRPTEDMDIKAFIEGIIEKRIKSRDFLQRE